MYTVLIVEDEMLVRMGLKSTINWGNLCMKVIGDVPNGQEALELYLKEKPDLILTDIKMPVMDGIELISRIREKDMKTRVIILTCYEEFDLIHKALSLGISGYILKLKMTDDEIESILKKVQAELDKDNVLKPDNHELIVDDNILKEQLFKKYIYYNAYSDKKFADMVNQMHLRLNPERLVMCYMLIEQFGTLKEEFMDKQGDLIRTAVLNTLNELLAGYRRGEAFHDNEERYMLVFSFSDIISENKIHEMLRNILERITNVIRTYIGARVTFIISGIHNTYPALVDMYNECRAAFEQKYYFSNEKYLMWNDFGTEDICKSIRHKLEIFLKEITFLDEEYRKEIEAGSKTLLSSFPINKLEIQKAFLRWVHWPAINLNINKNGVTKLAVDFALQVNQCENLDRAIEKFKNYLFEISRFEAKAKYISKEIAGAVKFIQSSYSNELSLQQVAAQVGISPNYLCSLFRKDLQMGFVEYLNQVRIDKAKEILLGTHLKLYEISQRVGFADVSYFSRTFKKLTGMRPNEYRKLWLPDVMEEYYAEKA